MTPSDIEVGVFAVRSFVCRENPDRLTSIAMPFEGEGYGEVCSDDWADGTCVAQCYRTDVTHGGSYIASSPVRRDPQKVHTIPVGDCTCGIYGAMTVDSLRRQYAWEASRIVAVIAPEGRTIMGPNGLRTARARVVAYWTPWFSRRAIAAARKQFVGAAGYTVLNDMLAAYGLPQAAPWVSDWAGQRRPIRIISREKVGIPA